MAEIKEFVVNDRRKFTAEGELRPDAPKSEHKPESKPEPVAETGAPEAPKGPQAVPSTPFPEATAEPEPSELPPPPTDEQLSQARAAYDATVERLDTAIRASNLGSEPLPEMNFTRFIQSVYMQAIIQLGGTAEPGTTPQVDLMGARHTIDMLGILVEKTQNNLSPDEDKLLQAALFEARMGFLEMTQLLSRQAAAKQGASGIPTTPPGPSIVK
jgi:hypothetical protein